MEVKKILVIAHCTDGDVAIGLNGQNTFTKEEANDILRNHIGLGADIEILEVE